jgi:tetratricopeptide (TPR) repeat protein
MTPPARTAPSTAAVLLTAAGLVLLTVTAFLPTARNSFVDLDDYAYVIDNARVSAGLGWAGVRWAFSAFWSSNWHPLTWLSHMLDVQLFGMNPGAHHLVSLALHAANVLLLYLVLLRATGALWASAFAAALFGVHPLHVESVAWVSERKDVLSGLFWLLAMAAYVRYARAPGLARYGAVAALFALGLMAKPMVVTLPFALLLLDWWPLQRIGAQGAGAFPAVPPGRALLEKVPLLALSAASAVVTYAAQQQGHTMYLMTRLSLGTRVSNALTSYAAYLGQALLPRNLACIYPHALPSPPPWQVAGAALLLAALTAAALWLGPSRRYLAVGWLWYLGTLVPVIGIVQVGFQSRADRYTYLPLVGLFVAVAFGARDALARFPRARIPAGAAAGALLALLAALTWRQTRVWEGSVPLFEHAVRAVPGNWMALHYLGKAHVDEGRVELGIPLLEEAVRLNPDPADSYYILGKAYAQLGRFEEAVRAYSRTVALSPGYGEAYSDLGFALGRLGLRDEQERAYLRAISLLPGSPVAYFNLGLAYLGRGDREAARRMVEALRRVDPKAAEQLARLAGGGRGAGAP